MKYLTCHKYKSIYFVVNAFILKKKTNKTFDSKKNFWVYTIYKFYFFIISIFFTLDYRKVENKKYREAKAAYFTCYIKQKKNFYNNTFKSAKVKFNVSFISFTLSLEKIHNRYKVENLNLKNISCLIKTKKNYNKCIYWHKFSFVLVVNIYIKRIFSNTKIEKNF